METITIVDGDFAAATLDVIRKFFFG